MSLIGLSDQMSAAEQVAHWTPPQTRVVLRLVVYEKLWQSSVHACTRLSSADFRSISHLLLNYQP